MAGPATSRLAAPGRNAPVNVYETPGARRAADHMGAFAFSYRGNIFLGRDPGIPGAPDRDAVLRHEMVHVLQSRRTGPTATRGALERQADGWQAGGQLLPADPEDVHGLLWVPFVLAAGYILLKPNTANAPAPGEKTYKSMDVKDYGKMVAEAAVLGSGGLVASGLRKAGYSAVTTWAVSGAYGSVGFRAAQDVSAGSFSGVDAYVVDGLTGATIGVVVGGTFHALGKLPTVSRARSWFMQGAENDPAYWRLSARDKALYEIGQKTLPKADFERLQHFTPVERGAELVKEQGWLKALLLPSSPKFLPGTGGTFTTGPTPLGRWATRSTTGFAAGATGNYLLGEPVKSAYGVGMESYGSTALLTADPWERLTVTVGGALKDPDAGLLAELLGHAQPVPVATPVIVVVPEGREADYFLGTGQLPNIPVPEGTRGLTDPETMTPAPKPEASPPPTSTRVKPPTP